MKTVEITMKKDGENVIVENNKGTRWEYKLRSQKMCMDIKAAFATIAASMLTATIIDAFNEDGKECKFQLTLL